MLAPRPEMDPPVQLGGLLVRVSALNPGIDEVTGERFTTLYLETGPGNFENGHQVVLVARLQGWYWAEMRYSPPARPVCLLRGGPMP